MKGERINICYGIADEKGTYSKLTGTSICSVFEKTTEPVTVHLIHDQTLTENNRRKFYELAQKYGQQIEFYNVSDRWRYVWERIRTKLPALVDCRCTIGMFYRLVIGDILTGERRVIYLDSDTIVNMDIRRLWEHEISESGLAAVPDSFVQKWGDKMIREGVVSREEYFNSGVLLIDLKKVNKVRNLIEKVLNFILRYRPDYPDQDALNYLFPHSAILPKKYNTFVNMAVENKWTLSDCIYHYADNNLGMNMDNEFNRLYFSNFIKTPWCDEIFVGRLAKNIEKQRFGLLGFANQCAGKRRIIIGPAMGRRAILNFLEPSGDDIYVAFEEIERYNLDFNRKKDIILIFLTDDEYETISKVLVAYGLVENMDFVNMHMKLGLEDRRMNEYGMFLEC